MMSHRSESSLLPAFYRQIRIDSDPGLLRARVVDNVHDLALTLQHDGTVITAVDAKANRIPWTTCPAAAIRLNELIGTPIDARPHGVDKSWQCTHLFDLARLAVSKALTLGHHKFDIEVLPAPTSDRVEAEARIDGRPVLHWVITDQRITPPPAFTSNAFDRASNRHSQASDDEVRTAELQLKRALLVYFGTRRSQFMQHAQEMSEMGGACFSFQPINIETAARPKGFRVYRNEEVS